MISAPFPGNEKARLAALSRYQLLDTPPEPNFDNLVQLASGICDTPISMISLIDGQRQWFKARHGIELKEMSRELAFCSYAILDHKPMVVSDLREDPRFRDHPLVLGPEGARFYAGVPLQTPAGHALGTLCVIDREPRKISSFQLFSLTTLAQQVIQLFQQRLYALSLQEYLSELNVRKQALAPGGSMQTHLLASLSPELSAPLTQLLSEEREML
ncbi:MAG: GAF domain-containing protein, partial [Candidatus Sericytochromatia bacterium]